MKGEKFFLTDFQPSWLGSPTLANNPAGENPDPLHRAFIFIVEGGRAGCSCEIATQVLSTLFAGCQAPRFSMYYVFSPQSPHIRLGKFAPLPQT